MMTSKLVNIIYVVIYHVIHYIYTICECCHELIRSKTVNQSIDFTKIPKHVTILLGNEEPSIQDLINIIEWSLAIGISFLSFYDYKGSLVKIEDKLISLTALKLQQTQRHVIWHHDANHTPKNGYSGAKIHVKLFQASDGKMNLVELCKQLAISSRNGKDIDITIDSLDHSLRKSYEFPDPDLAVHCGKTFSPYGYPPWQIRITEFFSISSHRNITFKTFSNLIKRYSSCEQRLGR